jgi:hypothetical protein
MSSVWAKGKLGEQTGLFRLDHVLPLTSNVVSGDLKANAVDVMSFLCIFLCILMFNDV